MEKGINKTIKQTKDKKKHQQTNKQKPKNTLLRVIRINVLPASNRSLIVAKCQSKTKILTFPTFFVQIHFIETNFSKFKVRTRKINFIS